MAKKTVGKDSEGEEGLEQALKTLEAIVEKLEEPELPLEESIELFEKGTRLSQICVSRLSDAEKKVEILLKKVPNPSSRDDFNLEEFESNETN